VGAFWTAIARPGPGEVRIDGVPVARGSRVRLRPGAGGDVLDLALAGRLAVVEGIDEDDEGRVRLAVTLDDDPGRDLGDARQPGHRFFFAPAEVEPLGPAASPRRVLVAGIGNVFLGDDGFGVEVVRRLGARRARPGVTVADFGIRGLDLAYALQDYDAAVFVDAAARGLAPGTLSVIDARADAQGDVVPEAHGMDPVRVLRLARALGRIPEHVLVLACEPLAGPAAVADAEVRTELSPPVRAAVETALGLIDGLVDDLRRPEGGDAS
jgi:hydrogenase maturation protease